MRLDVGGFSDLPDLNWREVRAAAALADLARELLGEMLCAWHGACCDRAAGTHHHPVFGAVAICGNCAGRAGIDITPFPPIPSWTNAA